MFSGEGNDDLDGGPNADSMTGGPDRDEVSYSGRTTGVSVDLDDVDDDGQSGERDNVRNDVEDITAGSGDDRLTGSSAAHQFFGGGNDTLDGGVGRTSCRAALTSTGHLPDSHQYDHRQHRRSRQRRRDRREGQHHLGCGEHRGWPGR